MIKEYSFINILTYKLDGKLARQIYKEYHDRLKNAKYLIESYKTYQVLRSDIRTVELLLALSIFHKRVIANLDAAAKFYDGVNTLSEAKTVKIGTYDLTGKEKNKILGIIINYNTLMKKFSVPHTIMDYNETNDFLRKLIQLKKLKKNSRDEDPPTNDAKNGGEKDETELPF